MRFMGEIAGKIFLKDDMVLESKDFKEEIINKGKSLYEVIRVIDGIPLFLEKHLERLNNSSKITNEEIWLSSNEIKNKLLKLIEVNEVKCGNIKFVFNFDNNKRCFLAYFTKHSYPSDEDYKNGVKTILYHGERYNPNAKVIDTDFRGKVNEQIKLFNAYEAILVDREGNITEGSKSNIFMIKGDKVITSPLEDVLPGVTRSVIIDICINIGLNVEEKKVYYRDIDSMDAAFISGTSPKVLPICFIDKKKYYSSDNSNVIKIATSYNKEIQRYILLNHITNI